jgi:hypothetical protein
MTTLYVDNIAPNLQSKISAPNLTLPTGSVIQVKSANKLGQVSLSTTGTWTSVNHSLNITPQFSTSKIFVMLTTSIVHSNSSGDNLVQIIRGNPVVTVAADNIYTDVTPWKGYNVTLLKLDSPATTSQITYEVRCWFNGGGSMLYNYTNAGFTESTLTAMEIAG